MVSNKVNIRELELGELENDILNLGEKKFRAKQIFEWLWQKDAKTFEEMTSLSKELRDNLENHYFIDHIVLTDQQISSDKTIKCAFTVDKNKVVEGVLIPTSSRTTACISSQIG